MRSLLGLGTLLLTGVAAFAQSPGRGIVALATPSGQGCPVGFYAQRAAGGGLIATDRSTRRSDRAYNLSFQAGAQPVIQAKVTLVGPAGPGLIPAGTQRGADESETFTVAAATGAHFLSKSVVYVRKVTSVRWIELNSITYADGTRWDESSATACRIAPNGFMLVASGN